MDVRDVEALQRRYAELALRLGRRVPAAATTFDRLARASTTMLATLRALAARSDPHAAN